MVELGITCVFIFVGVINKGSVDRIREDISRMDDDIKKAKEYKEETEDDVDQLNAELSSLTVRKLKAELEDLCKQHWLEVPKCRKALAEQQDMFHKLMLDIRNLHTTALQENISIAEEVPQDARALLSAVLNEAKTFLAKTESHLLQRKQDLEQLIRQQTYQTEEIKQNNAVESRVLRDQQREQTRAERQRKYERDEWEKDVIAAEADIGSFNTNGAFPLQHFSCFLHRRMLCTYFYTSM
ncbi:hypothetical protein ANCCEY_05529 [Ancylostoma ceylanicum]|uniref:Uncharacterized protein n=1 Tax=Ancylostoma ceylanicum TaxID=53326 RepID=A0A0D6LTI9_9BILA|nr:hypothetical protein ANCCEY_05529 [Ancylostoma ceylanicum]